MENKEPLSEVGKALFKVDKEPLSEGIMNIVRGFTRPALTFFGLVSVVMMRINNIDPPTGFEPVVYGMVAWWFTDRTISKLKGVPK